jgi:hypothetical protein
MLLRRLETAHNDLAARFQTAAGERWETRAVASAALTATRRPLTSLLAKGGVPNGPSDGSSDGLSNGSSDGSAPSSEDLREDESGGEDEGGGERHEPTAPVLSLQSPLASVRRSLLAFALPALLAAAARCSLQPLGHAGASGAMAFDGALLEFDLAHTLRCVDSDCL